MDPLSALSLAGNISQVLDLGTKIVSGSLQMCRSADGASSTNSHLETMTSDLTRLCAALLQPENHIDQQHAIKAELALIPLSQSCKALGEEFLSILNALKVKSQHKRFDSIRQALKGVWKEKEIRIYEKRLKSYRTQIALHLIEILR